MDAPQNYIPDHNRFKLAGPPDWWLRQLWDFDSSLVVVPSRQDCVYRLAQRRKLSLPAHIVNDILFQQSDTQMLASYGLIPVTSILATAQWSPLMFEMLKQRAPWRQDGAAAVERRLADEEEKEELNRREATTEHLSALSKDAWGLYNKKIGLRTHMWSPKTGGPKPPVLGPLVRIT